MTGTRGLASRGPCEGEVDMDRVVGEFNSDRGLVQNSGMYQGPNITMDGFHIPADAPCGFSN